MKFTRPASWPADAKAAIALQAAWADRVERQDRLGPVRRVAGLDVGFEHNNTVVRAAVAILSFPDLTLLEHAVTRRPVEFPYVPGLLSFRETPALLDVLETIHQTPDVILCDGQGLAHPRRFGLACHLGVLLDIPSIGVAKSLLVGEHAPLAVARGAWQALRHRDEVVGAALRTRRAVSPVYVSIGHRVSLPTAIDLVLACAPRYRLPETTRHAHRLASMKLG